MPPVKRSVPGTERYPYPGYNFVIRFTNVKTETAVSGSFAEASGLTVEVTPIEYRDGTDDTTVRKVRGLRKISNITLKRGVSGHDSFWRWILDAIGGDARREEGYIALLNEDKQEVMRWTFKNAWPTKYSGPSFNAKNGEIAMETVEIVAEDLQLQL